MAYGTTLQAVSDVGIVADRQRISQTLFSPDRDGFSSIAALPSNVRAIEAALLFSSGMQTFGAIVGPSGWGKTHLLNAAAKTIRRRQSTPVSVVRALDWASNNSTWDTFAPVLLDDVQDALNQTRSRQNLRIALEKRVKSGRPTLLSFVSERSTRTIRAFLPCSREWTIALISEPPSVERELVARQIASSKGMSVAPAISNLLAKKTIGNGRSIEGALERLKLVQSRWVDAASILQACGVLGPYLSDDQGWDIRDHVNETVSGVVIEADCRDCPADPVSKLGVYLMLVDVGIGEEEVAAYFNITPGEVYASAQRVSEAIFAGPLRDLHRACVQGVLRSIEQL